MNNIVASSVTPGVLGFFMVALIGAALYFLIKSMHRHLNRVSAISDTGASAVDAHGKPMIPPREGGDA